MAEYKEIILSELKLQKIEPWKRIAGNWAYKTDIGVIFAKISNDKHVSRVEQHLACQLHYLHDDELKTIKSFSW